MYRESTLACALVLWCAVVGLAAAQEPAEIGQSYRVGPGDVIAVEAFQYEEISGAFPVEENGAFTFPLLGEVEVAGRTTAEISRILEGLLEEDYYVDVQLQVEVKEYRSQPVVVLGEVQRPGTYYLEGRTTVTQILAGAGGLKSTAGPMIELRSIDMADGEEVPSVRTFTTSKVATGEEGRDIELRPGDVLSVSARQLYFVQGEVARPGQYEISADMTLMQAISQAGGQGKFASQSVELHRDSEGGKEILTFDLSRIRKGKEQDPPIKASDVIIVRRRFF